MTTALPIRVAVAGFLGKMGSTVSQAVLHADDMQLVAVADPACENAAAVENIPAYPSLAAALDAHPVDVVVDFTIPHAVLDNIFTCLDHRVAVVVGTTGPTDEDLDEVRRRSEAGGTPVFVAPNFAIGAVLMMRFAREAASQFKACEVIELHHERKLDAPSGTAARTADLVRGAWLDGGYAGEVPIHSVRLPGLMAHQEVIFGAEGQTLTIRHDTLARESFVPGVLLAVREVRQLQGVVVGLENLL